MADFDPEMNVEENIEPVPNNMPPMQAEAYNPSGQNKFTRNTNHPVMIIIFILFKLWFVVFGIIAMFFKISSFVQVICVALGLAFDFYVCKNFAGRYLAGLRWHTYVVDGKTWYYFEADEREMSKMEKIIFWSGMWFTPVYYTAITIAQLLTIQWFSIPLNVLGIIASSTNLIAYLKCSRDAKARMSMIASEIAEGASKAAMNYGAEQMEQGMQ